MRFKFPKLGKLEIGILLGFFLLLAFLFWVYFYWLVWETKEVNIGPIQEVQQNDYFAAQKFLENQGVDSHLSFSPVIFENMRVEQVEIENSHAIVLLQGRGVVNGDRFSNLWSWLEKGGTLIMSIESSFFRGERKEDELFGQLGIELESLGLGWYDEDEQVEEEEELVAAENEEKNTEQGDEYTLTYLESAESWCAGGATEVDIPEESDPLLVDFSWSDRFTHDGEFLPAYTARDKKGLVFANFSVGEGQIYISSSLSFWKNRKIACHDHAYLLRRLVSDSDKVWFLVNKEVPSLVKLVWNGIPLAVLACMAAVMLTLWRMLIRFGPIFPDRKIERRSFSEHIRASADFLWRNELHESFIEQLRKDLVQKLSQRNPGFESMNEEDRMRCLLRYCQLRPEEIQLSLNEPTSGLGRKDFVLIVNSLKKIKDQL